jgi:N-acyl-D-amino-acid deacylase
VSDLLVANALVVDGSGGSPFPGSMLVREDRIERILREGDPEPRAERRVDAGGRILAPGFIDVHSHSDVTPFVEPGMDSMLRQGVTTVVVGNCGGSAYPVEGAPEMAAIAGAEAERLGLDWRTFGEYLERIDACHPALNVAALVGHGTLRETAMQEQRRAPSADEMTTMQRLLEDALEAGAVGLSTGLVYAPGLHATTDEIVELASVLGRRGGVYASHIRGEGEVVFDAVAECIEIGRRVGVPSHISHLKVETRPMWGRAGALLDLIDAERDRGADVTADQYPYTAWETELASALPPWTSPDELPEVLADPHARQRLRDAVEDGEPGWQSLGRGIGWDNIVIVSHANAHDLSGRSLAAIAEERGVEPFEAIARLLIADRYTGILGHAMHEDDVRAIVAREDVFVATDGLAVSPSGPLGLFNVHPRYYGTFPRVLARYVRDEGTLSLEAAVRKMTSLPAERFGLAGRGRIAEGAFADLVVFDPERVADRASFEVPHAFAQGFDLVVVNGRVAWDGRPGSHAGRALRRS